MAQGGLEHWESWPTLSRHCRTQLEIIRLSVRPGGNVISSSLRVFVVKRLEWRGVKDEIQSIHVTGEISSLIIGQ